MESIFKALHSLPISRRRITTTSRWEALLPTSTMPISQPPNNPAAAISICLRSTGRPRKMKPSGRPAPWRSTSKRLCQPAWPAPCFRTTAKTRFSKPVSQAWPEFPCAMAMERQPVCRHRPIGSDRLGGQLQLRRPAPRPVPGRRNFAGRLLRRSCGPWNGRGRCGWCGREPHGLEHNRDSRRR